MMRSLLAGALLTAIAAVPGPLAAQSPIVKEGHAPGADGVRLFYRMVGSGRDTVIVVHGGPATGMREGFDLEPLAGRGYTLLFYDQRGAGQSDLVARPSELTLPAHVADLEALRRHFKLQRPSLIGIGWGAAVVLHHALAYPGAADHLVFLSPMAPTGLRFVGRFAELDSLRPAETRARIRAVDSAWATAPDADLPALCREGARLTSMVYTPRGGAAVEPRGDSCDYPANVLRHRRLARLAALRALGAVYDFSAGLARLTRPVLVIEGADSPLSLDATRHWARQPENGRLLLVKGAGYRAWVDRPGAVVEAVDEFFGGEWPEGVEQ